MDSPSTELFIINPEAYETDRELVDIEQKIEDLSEKAGILGDNLNMAKEKNILFEEMSRYFSLQKEIGTLTSKKENLEGTKPKPKSWKIEVSDTMYPTVSVFIGDTKIEKEEKVEKVYYYGNKRRTQMSILSIKKWL